MCLVPFFFKSIKKSIAALDDVDELGAQALPAGPGALLVEVEDVVEESAAMMDILDVQPQSAVYSIAPSELRQTAQFRYYCYWFVLFLPRNGDCITV
jgi:hypothetical protein